MKRLRCIVALLVSITAGVSLGLPIATMAQAPGFQEKGLDQCWTPSCQCYRPCVDDRTEGGAREAGRQIGEAIRNLLSGIFSGDSSPKERPRLSRPPQGQTTHNPTFDCTKTEVAAEDSVCTSEELSRLDRQLGGEYVRLLQKLDRPRRVKLAYEQRDWIADRDACEDDQACISRKYTQRIGEFRRRFAQLEGQPASKLPACVQSRDPCKSPSDCECSKCCGSWDGVKGTGFCSPTKC
jgi:uncharacterized protein YecT (DUF1311 family)